MGWVETPSSNEEYTTGACWHGDVDLKAISWWHASAYLCTLLGCFGDVPQTSVDDGEPHDVGMESKGNGALDVYDDALHCIFVSRRNFNSVNTQGNGLCCA
jgi:hypothetical protein